MKSICFPPSAFCLPQAAYCLMRLREARWRGFLAVMPAMDKMSPLGLASVRPRLFSAAVGLVVIRLPAFVIAQGLSHGAAVMAAVHGHVMLVAVVADVFQQLLHLRDPDHSVAAETLWPVAGDFALADVGA